jgi:LPS O-antigen subunit length determinant protein (WzzB/FepE family)
MKDVSLGLAAVPIIKKASDLQQFEKGRIHYIDEIVSRTFLAVLVKNFYTITLCKNTQSSLSLKASLATISTPCILALLKSSYVSNYVSPQIVSMAARTEKHIGRLCYMASVINAVALISFGHLIVGYTALTIFSLDLITSSTFIQTRIPSLNKTRIIFVKYISPFTELTTGIATRSYLTIALALFGLYSLFSEEYYKTTAIVTPPPIKSLEEFTTLWNDLQQKQSELFFEMHRERVPQIQIPSLDPSQYPQNQILEIFDTINWDREDFQKSLWNRVTGIAESDPEKTFKDLENTSLEETKTHRQKQLPRAITMAREWLQAVLKETTKQDLIFFKQHICKMLLEHRDLLEKNQTEESRRLFNGLLTLIFGSGGECHVAQDMKIKDAYLEIYRASNKETNQPSFLLMLELAYKNTTEQAFKDVLNPILQKILQDLVEQAERNLAFAQKNLRREWEQRSLSRIHCLASSIFSYLLAERHTLLYKEAQEALDLNSVHNFTRVARLFGKPFNIATDTDEVAERTFSNMAMNPKTSSLVKALNIYIPLTLGKFYWDVQLEKIIHPWLITHFEEQTYFQINDLRQWFHHLFEGFRTEGNTEEIDAMQEGLSKVVPEICGLKLARYQENSKGENILVPTTQASLAFAYGINLLKKKDPNTPSFFNHIDQELSVTENEDLDFTSIEKNIQRIPKWIPFSKDIQEKINDPLERYRITNDIHRSRRELTSSIDETTLFFAQ